MWIDLSVLCVMSRVSSFFRLVFLPPPLCGWSAVVLFAISCAIGHGCSECGSGFLTRDWLGHEVGAGAAESVSLSSSSASAFDLVSGAMQAFVIYSSANTYSRSYLLVYL